MGDPQGNGHPHVMAFPGYNSINTTRIALDMVDGVFTDQSNPERIDFIDKQLRNYSMVQPITRTGMNIYW